MKTLTAYTHEIDNVEAAVAEILEQLNLEETLCKNSVGIISCYPEFLDSGVVEALCEALPFDVLGATTLAVGSAGEYGFTMLSLMVMTGDDVSFSAMLSDDILQEQEKPIQEMCKKALADIKDEAKMIMLYAPIISHIGSEIIVNIMDSVCGGIPIFGTLASDHTDDYQQTQAIYNGKGYQGQIAILVIGGNVDPQFSIMSIPEEKVLRQKAIVTESSGNVLVSVNDMSVIEYLRTIGLVAEDTSIEGVLAIPVMVDFSNDTEPIAIALLINEDGTASSGSQVPKGASLSVGTIIGDDVANATKDVVKQILDCKNNSGVIMYSCLSRMLVLGVDAEAELAKIGAGLSAEIPYTLSYSGGEICPVKDKDGKFVNSVHNFSLISCVF